MSEICSICREGLEFGSLSFVDCVHVHHEVCLDNWLRNRARNRQTCPICRKKIRNIQVLYQANRPNEQEEENNSVEIMVEVPQENSQSMQENAPPVEIPEIVIEPQTPPPTPESQPEAPRFSPVIVSTSSTSANETGAAYWTTGISQDSGSTSIGLEIRTSQSPIFTPSDVNQLAGVAFEPRSDGTTNSFLLLRSSGSEFNNEPGPSRSRSDSSQSRINTDRSSVTRENGQQSDSLATREVGRARASRFERNFFCPNCRSSFRLRNSLLRHISRTHSHQFPCRHPSCNQTFRTLHKFEAHMKTLH